MICVRSSKCFFYIAFDMISSAAKYTNELKTRTAREIIDVANGNAVEEKAFRRVESGSPESVLNYKKLYECV